MHWLAEPCGEEYFFSDGGIASSGDLSSHKNPQMPDSKPEVGAAKLEKPVCRSLTWACRPTLALRCDTRLHNGQQP